MQVFVGKPIRAGKVVPQAAGGLQKLSREMGKAEIRLKDKYNRFLNYQ